MADDYTNDTSTTGTVTVGGSVTGEIESTGDEDWFAVELVAGRTYRIDLEGSPTGKGTLTNPAIHGIHDSNGAVIGYTADDNGGTGENARTSFTPTASGTYYVSAGTWASHLGTYTLSVTLTDDFLADTSTTGAVAVGGSAEGEVNFGRDRDWFAVELVAGKTYQIDLEGWVTGAGNLLDSYLEGIYDSDGNFIEGTDDDDGGIPNNSRVSFTPTESGTYYVSAGSVGRGTGTYTLSVRDADDDFLASTRTAGAATVGGSVTGEIETDTDRDWFAVELTAGKVYRFDLEGSSTDAGTLYDPVLWGIHDSNGDTVAGTFADGGGTGHNGRLFFTPTASGTYYVDAGAWAGSGQTGTYKLSVAVADDFVANPGTPGTVTESGPVTGEIETDTDRDWFAVELEAGKVYRFDLEGSSTNAGTLYDPVLWGIHDSSGDKIAGTFADGGGTGHNARLFFTTTASGTYYVDAGAWAGSGQTGTYKLSVTGDDFAAGTGTTGAVTVDTIDWTGVRNTGKVDHAGDRDWFAVELVAGTSYRFDLEGTTSPATGGALADPSLHGIHDSHGNVIAGTADDNGGTGLNSRVIFTPTESGTYYVAAGGAGDGTGAYGLSVMTDVLAHDTSTTGRVTVGGSATSEIDSMHDADWIAVELVAGTTYRIDMEGQATGAGTLPDPYLNGIYSSTGGFIGRTLQPGNRDGGTGNNARITFTPTESGTYYISAGDAGANASNLGTYTVSVEEVL